MAKKAYVNDGNDWVELASSNTDLSGYLLESSASTTYATKTELNNIDLSSASAAAVAAIVDSAPSTLNTLNELAAALGDDSNYASTITTALGNKLDISTASSTYLTQVDASSTYANMTTTPISGFRNAIINGDFRVNQRAFTSTTTNNAYGFDRWQLATADGTCTYSTLAFTAGNAISGYEPINYARMVTSGQTLAGAYSILVQKIEDVRTFAGQTITISFWAKSASGTPKVVVETEQYFGTGGSPSANVTSYAGQVTLSTSWNRYSVTITVPSISGKTIGTTANTSFFELNLWVSGGSSWNSRTGSLGIQSNTFDFWGVQVEKGTIATPFEQRPIGTELLLCQRYFSRRNVYASGATGGGGGVAYIVAVQFEVKMRISPVVSWISGGIAMDGTTDVNITGLYSPLPYRNGTEDGIEVLYNGPAFAGDARPVAVRAALTTFNAEL
jgi:hypothetical protein